MFGGGFSGGPGWGGPGFGGHGFGGPGFGGPGFGGPGFGGPGFGGHGWGGYQAPYYGAPDCAAQTLTRTSSRASKRNCLGFQKRRVNGFKAVSPFKSRPRIVRARAENVSRSPDLEQT